MLGIQRRAAILSIIASLVGLFLSAGCSFQARPPELHPSDVAYITVWVRDEEWNLEQRRAFDSTDYSEIKQFVEAWSTLETLRPPRYPESDMGEAEIQISLSGGRHWTLRWQPARGEAVFRLSGTGTLEMVDRSPMKVESNEMLQLLEEWVGRLVWPPPRP